MARVDYLKLKYSRHNLKIIFPLIIGKFLYRTTCRIDNIDIHPGSIKITAFLSGAVSEKYRFFHFIQLFLENSWVPGWKKVHVKNRELLTSSTIICWFSYSVNTCLSHSPAMSTALWLNIFDFDGLGFKPVESTCWRGNVHRCCGLFVNADLEYFAHICFFQ